MQRWKLRPQAYGMLLRSLRLKHARPVVLRRLRWLQYASCFGVATTLRHFHISRSTLLRWADRFDPKNPIDSLSDKTKSPHTVRVPDTDARTIDIIRTIRRKYPELGKNPVTDILRKRHGISIAPATVGRIIQRHRFYFADTESHRQKRGESLDSSESVMPVDTNDALRSLDDDSVFLVPSVTS